MKTLAVSGRSAALRSHLEGVCRRLGPGAKLPRLADLQAELATSPSTLTRVLGEMELDGLVTRRRAVGIFVAPDAPLQCEHLALVCRPSFFQTANHSPMWDMLLELLNERAQAGGASFDSYFARENDAEQPLSTALMREVESGNIGGVMGIGLSAQAALWLMERVPVVNLYGKGHVIVSIDLRGAIALGVEQLRARGCRRIGLWVPAITTGELSGAKRSWRHNRTAFRLALRERQMPFLPELVRDNEGWFDVAPRDQPSLAEQGYQTARAVFGGDGPHPDGVFISDDLMARGALTALREIGARGNVQIATLGNVGSSVLLGETDLTIAEFDPAAVAATMWQQMEQLLAQPPDSWPEDQHFKSPAHLRGA